MPPALGSGLKAEQEASAASNGKRKVTFDSAVEQPKAKRSVAQVSPARRRTTSVAR